MPGKRSKTESAPVNGPAPVVLPSRLRNLKPNQYSCLGYIRRMSDCSRDELEQFFGWKSETVTRLTRPFIDDGVLLTRSAKRPGDKRRRTYLYLNPELMYSIGVELSFSTLRAGIVDLGGNVVARTDDVRIAGLEPRETIDHLLRQVRRLTSGNARFPVTGVGVSYSGHLSPEGRAWRSFPSSTPWDDVPLRQTLSDALRQPIEVHLDSIAGAMAELRFGKAIRCSDFVFVHMSDGIGLAIVLNGIVNEGSRNVGAEFGHICVQPNGPWCYCGANGCLEAVSSSWAILHQVRSRLQTGVFTRHLAVSNPDDLTLRDVCVSSAAGERLATDVLRLAGEWLGVSISNVVDLIDPEQVIVGGSLADDDSYGPIVEQMREAYAHGVHSYRPVRVEMIRSELGEDAYIIGAAATMFERAIPAHPPQLLLRGTGTDKPQD